MLEFFFILCAFINCKAKLQLLAKSYSLPVYNYVNYGSATISNYQVPPDVSYISFSFIPEPSVGCGRETIHVDIRFGSLPVIDPGDFKFPDDFLIDNQRLYSLTFLSTKVDNYINITSPLSGFYFVVVFRNLLDPRMSEPENILTQNPNPCKVNLTTDVYVENKIFPTIRIFNTTYPITLYGTESYPLRYRFFKPKKPEIKYAKVTLTNITFPNDSSYFFIKLTQSGVPKSSLILYEDKIKSSSFVFYYTTLEDDVSYGINFFLKNKTNSSVKFNFDIQEYLLATDKLIKLSSIYPNQRLWNSKPFTFYFQFSSKSNSIKLVRGEVFTLLFVINDGFDVGGTLSFHISAKLNKSKMIIVCINNTREIPTWPNLCDYNNRVYISSIVLNATVTKAVVHIPYPLPGTWYASFALKCFNNKACSGDCKNYHTTCETQCATLCEDTIAYRLCFKNCMVKIEKSVCENLEMSRNPFSCKSAIELTVASYECFRGTCANGGACETRFSQGLSYSVCICPHQFRGWTCSNDRYITSPQMIRLELFLLVSSSLIFLLAGYIAFKRMFYEESVAYVSKFVFTSLNHLCNSGKYLYNLCITKENILLQADLYSGSLSIWVTIIAMAYLRKPLRNVFHVIGAILIVFCILNNTEGLHVAMMSLGILIIIINWTYLNVQSPVRFPSRFYSYVYLPLGIVAFSVAWLFYTLLQNESNYMYVHSVFHIFFGLSFIILLPDEQFLSPTQHPHSLVAT